MELSLKLISVDESFVLSEGKVLPVITLELPGGILIRSYVSKETQGILTELIRTVYSIQREEEVAHRQEELDQYSAPPEPNAFWGEVQARRAAQEQPSRRPAPAPPPVPEQDTSYMTAPMPISELMASKHRERQQQAEMAPPMVFVPGQSPSEPYSYVPDEEANQPPQPMARARVIPQPEKARGPGPRPFMPPMSGTRQIMTDEKGNPILQHTADVASVLGDSDLLCMCFRVEHVVCVRE